LPRCSQLHTPLYGCCIAAPSQQITPYRTTKAGVGFVSGARDCAWCEKRSSSASGRIYGRELLAFRGGARRGWRGAHVFALADE
jgi:hypothetical protein